jgi:taurine dioxygenase
VQIYKSPDSPIDRYENAWHSDASWRKVPPMGCVLRCIECPQVGGDTMWTNMILAYENLPEEIKAKIDGCAHVTVLKRVLVQQCQLKSVWH